MAVVTAVPVQAWGTAVLTECCWGGTGPVRLTGSAVRPVKTDS